MLEQIHFHVMNAKSSLPVPQSMCDQLYLLNIYS